MLSVTPSFIRHLLRIYEVRSLSDLLQNYRRFFMTYCTFHGLSPSDKGEKVVVAKERCPGTELVPIKTSSSSWHRYHQSYLVLPIRDFLRNTSASPMT